MSFSSTNPSFRMVWRLSGSVHTLVAYIGAGTGGQLGAQTDKMKKSAFRKLHFPREEGCHACLFKEDCLYTIFDNALWDIRALKKGTAVLA